MWVLSSGGRTMSDISSEAKEGDTTWHEESGHCQTHRRLKKGMEKANPWAAEVTAQKAPVTKHSGAGPVLVQGCLNVKNKLRDHTLTKKRFEVPNIEVWGRRWELETEEPLKQEVEPFTCKAWGKLCSLSLEENCHPAKIVQLIFQQGKLTKRIGWCDETNATLVKDTLWDTSWTHKPPWACQLRRWSSNLKVFSARVYITWKWIYTRNLK